MGARNRQTAQKRHADLARRCPRPPSVDARPAPDPDPGRQARRQHPVGKALVTEPLSRSTTRRRPRPAAAPPAPPARPRRRPSRGSPAPSSPRAATSSSGHRTTPRLAPGTSWSAAGSRAWSARPGAGSAADPAGSQSTPPESRCRPPESAGSPPPATPAPAMPPRSACCAPCNASRKANPKPPRAKPRPPMVDARPPGEIVQTCGSRSLGCFGLGFVLGSFYELAVDERGAVAGQGDQVLDVDRALSSCRGPARLPLNLIWRHADE